MPHQYHFSFKLMVRIDDINYGNHLSNDAYLKYLHEARMRFLANYSFTEMNLAGTSVIMGDAALVFKGECFYGDELLIEVAATDFGKKSFNLYYNITNAKTGSEVCHAKTAMVCFNYTLRCTAYVPEAFSKLF